MNTDKFTLRDFFVFFLSGISVLFCFCITQYNFICYGYDNIKNTDSRVISLVIEFPTMFGLLSIPVFYLIGQITHGIDDFIFQDSIINSIKKHRNKNWLFSKLDFLIRGNRVSGYVSLKDENVEVFWQKFYTLQANSLSQTSDYWYIMNELFKGLTLTCLVLGIVALFNGQHALLMFFIMMISWKRARFFAKRFYFSVTKSYIGLNEATIKPKN